MPFRLTPRRPLAITSLALCALTAQAQTSNVTVSGTLDIGLYRGFDKTTNVGPISRSDLTFKGSEDLGDGLKAIFKLQHRFETDTGGLEAGGKPFWHGEATVGLQSATLGRLRLGRALDAIWDNDWAFDPWENFDRIASPAWQLWHYQYASDRTSNTGSAEYGRLNNGVFYDSPTVGGFTLHLSGSPEKATDASTGAGHNAGASLNYAQGAAQAMVAYSTNRSGDMVAFIGGRYQFGDLTLMGALDHSGYKATTGLLATADVYSVGAVYQVGKTAYKASYGHLKAGDSSQGFIGLGASHALSRRTDVYLSLGHKRPDEGSTSTAFGLGVNHRF